MIDAVKTGENIKRLRGERSLTVSEAGRALRLAVPQTVYRWQRGETLPNIDNLYALGCLFEVKMDDIVIPEDTGG